MNPAPLTGVIPRLPSPAAATAGNSFCAAPLSPLLFARVDALRSPQTKVKGGRSGRRVAPAPPSTGRAGGNLGDAAAADRVRTAVAQQYPMYLMPVQELLKLDRFEPHQKLLRESLLRPGLLVKYQADRHRGRVIFASHQWAGHNHPDPDNEQLRCLQRLLQRMMAGEIERIQVRGERKSGGWSYLRGLRGRRGRVG